VPIWRETKLFDLKKIGTKLNKNNEYINQIEYKTLLQHTEKNLKKNYKVTRVNHYSLPIII